MFIIKELDPSEFEEVKVYDGDLNPMTFNLVKSSKAFDKNKIDIDDDLSWLSSNDLSTTRDTYAIDERLTDAKRSEDGWNKTFNRT